MAQLPSETVERLLRMFAGECTLDHNGTCQAHNFRAPCVVPVLRDAVSVTDDVVLTDAETELCVSACLMRAGLIIAAEGENPALDAIHTIWPENGSADALEIGTQVALALTYAFDLDPAMLAEVALSAAPSESK